MNSIDYINHFIKEIADRKYNDYYKLGHATAGVNGPYQFKDTPVRNTGHWLIVYKALFR